jgi:hypothetical protein
MAATVQDPPRKLAGREGPLKWAINPHKPDEWLAPDGERCPARIVRLTNAYIGKEYDTYYVIRSGIYFGVRRSLPDAKKLAEGDKPDPHPERDLKTTVDGKPDGIPVHLEMSPAERRYHWSKAPPLNPFEMRTSWYNYKKERMAKGEDLGFMSKYEAMGLEQLTRIYNELVVTAREKGHDRFRQVPRFKDKDEALRATEAIESSIRAVDASDKAITQEARDKTGPTAREVIPASPKPEKESDTMAKKAKKATNGNGKKKAAAAPKKKAAAAEKAPRPGKVGAFLDTIGTRAGGYQEKAATALFNSLGKPMKLEALCKATYGKAEVVPAINGVINGLRTAIDDNKQSYNIQRDRKEGTVGLFAGKE